jgi:hypothetical protein
MQARGAGACEKGKSRNVVAENPGIVAKPRASIA